MKKILIISVLCMSAGFAWAETCTTGNDCMDYAERYCGGGAPACFSGSCGCMSCPTGTKCYPASGSSCRQCACDKDTGCYQNANTNSSTHLSTITYKTRYSGRSCTISGVGVSTLDYYCQSQGTSYECELNYGHTGSSATASTKCYPCDGVMNYSVASGWSSGLNNNSRCLQNTVFTLNGKKYFKAWNVNSWTGPTRAPSSVSTSNCGPCSSDCWYVSSMLYDTGSNCYGIILNGCPAKYATTGCSATAAGGAAVNLACLNTVAKGGECVCNTGYYGDPSTNSNPVAASCKKCPEDASGLQTSATGATAVSQCYIPTGKTISDDTGEFQYDSACYYSVS